MGSEEVLKKIAGSSGDEFFSPVPEGYEKGKTKFIIIAGSVMSGVGKGIFASSLAKLLKYYGLNVAPIKIDGYLNQDAGTLNPFRHGEVFVLDDGLECDMDLGSYERFLMQPLSRENYLTAGMIFDKILKRERKGDYLGRDVQFIPHVTGEVKQALRKLAVKSKADVVLVEIGGTVGDFENAYVIEAMREMIYEEGKNNTCFINISYILEPPNLGEQKSKPAQLGIERLRGLGIQPDIMVCRSSNPIADKIKEKISVYSNVEVENVIGLHNTDTVYKAPFLLKDLKADERVVSLLNLNSKISNRMQKKELERWNKFVEKYTNIDEKVTIGIAGKYTGLNDSYASILKALEHAGTHNNLRIKIKYIETTAVEEGKLSEKEALEDVDGLIVPGGFGKRGAEGKIKCIRYARRKKIPFLGLCFGFQMAVIEFARVKAGMENADSTELEPEAQEPVIDILPEQKKIEGLGGNMRLGGQDVEIKRGTKSYELYGKENIRLRFRHRYEVNPKYISKLEESGIVFSGKHPKYNIMQVLELKDHPYFLATQAHPEFNSRPLEPEPLFNGFISAARNSRDKFV
ncbi:CTP synthase (glutamine hydrolyzing) [Candidatus Woesearchaeota archaeon]|nr:CTP synthase (glutamine hydrolyzing) [Candidatus Woesearchaeota archaeon]